MARDTIYDEAMVRVGGTVRPDQKSYIDRRWRELNMTGRSELLRWIIDEYMQREEGEDRE